MASEHFPPGYVDDLVAKLEAKDAAVVALRTPAGPFAGLELYLPTALALFVASSYFGGIIGKIGEDHYEAVKRVAKQLYARASGLRVTTIGSAGKVADQRKLSLSYSIIGELAPRLRLKLMLDAEIADQDAARAIDAFLILIRDIHSDEVSPGELERLLEVRPIGGLIIVSYDDKSGRILPVDSRD
jgi:hypothetical protein